MKARSKVFFERSKCTIDLHYNAIDEFETRIIVTKRFRYATIVLITLKYTEKKENFSFGTNGSKNV